MKYRIVRFHANSDIDNKIIEENVSLEEAKKHCNDPETSSRTAKGKEAIEYTKEFGQWFDGFEEE